jgi:hypothetical protein
MFNDNSNQYQYYDQGAPTDNNVYTYSTWMKGGSIGSQMFLWSVSDDTANNWSGVWLSAADLLYFADKQGGVNKSYLWHNAALRDTSSWYHILLVVNTDAAAAVDRQQIYVNGVQDVTNNDNYTSGQATLNNVNSERFYHGIDDVGNSSYFDGILAETHFIDGQALTPADFGTTQNGVWVPVKYTGTYGNNGFYLDYSNSADFGEDQSGNNNDLTDVNFSANHQWPDTPTNNYNNLNRNNREHSATIEFLDGNTMIYTTAGSAYSHEAGTHVLTTGKWYWEAYYSYVQGTAALTRAGYVNVDNIASTPVCGINYAWGGDAGNVRIYPGGAASANLDYPRQGDYWGFAVDCDAEKVWIHRNNTWATETGDPDAAGAGLSFTMPTNGLLTQLTGWGDGSNNNQLVLNCGQYDFQYTAPVGFKHICSKEIIRADNLNQNLYLEGDKGFDIDLYEGTGAELARANLEFSPDFVWIKDRDDTYSNIVFDKVRAAENYLLTNSTGVEVNDAQTLKSFDDNGFTLGTATGVNNSGDSFVSWNWLESVDYGFDIVGYEGTGVARTVAHSLGVVPEMMIVKNRDSVYNWGVYHKDLDAAAPEDKYLLLNTLDAVQDSVNLWNDTAPTSSVFTVGIGATVNENLSDHIAYLFASIPGYSKVFSYSGNGLADGPFIHLGFRPRFLLLKNIARSANWTVYDTSRSTYNLVDDYLLPASNAAEAVGFGSDLLANGFKIKNTSLTENGSGETIVGIAFAETPHTWANAR